MIRDLPRTLYVIAPTLMECVLTARDFGLTEGQMQHFRNVTSAFQLRGTTPGTPFIARTSTIWSAGPHADELAVALRAMQAQGRLRIAQESELSNYRMFDDIPFREARR
ncbi:hypothetical protein [Shinella sp. M31]|uniref:hypothetical protein n=1 Tax=Shinella sp. M31 TaxID=3368615 RepID=UPI003BA36E46